jgi:uncharacterized phage-associated protein
MMNKEDFEQWRVDPVTQAVFNKLQQIADNAKRQWMEISFAGNIDKIDIVLLSKLRAYHILCTQIVNISYEDLGSNEERQRQTRFGDT